MVVFSEITGFVYKNTKLFQYLVTSVESVKNGGELPRPGWTWVLRPAQMKSLISLLIIYAQIVENVIEIYGEINVEGNPSNHEKQSLDRRMANQIPSFSGGAP